MPCPACWLAAEPPRCQAVPGTLCPLGTRRCSVAAPCATPVPVPSWQRRVPGQRRCLGTLRLRRFAPGRAAVPGGRPWLSSQSPVEACGRKPAL